MEKRKKISDEENGNNLSRYVKRRLAKKNSNVDTGEMQDNNEEIMEASELTTELGLYSLNGGPSNLLNFIDKIENTDNKLENMSTDEVSCVNHVSINNNISNV